MVEEDGEGDSDLLAARLLDDSSAALLLLLLLKGLVMLSQDTFGQGALTARCLPLASALVLGCLMLLLLLLAPGANEEGSVKYCPICWPMPTVECQMGSSDEPCWRCAVRCGASWLETEDGGGGASGKCEVRYAMSALQVLGEHADVEAEEEEEGPVVACAMYCLPSKKQAEQLDACPRLRTKLSSSGKWTARSGPAVTAGDHTGT